MMKTIVQLCCILPATLIAASCLTACRDETDDTSTKKYHQSPYILFGVGDGDNTTNWIVEQTSRAAATDLDAELPSSVGLWGCRRSSESSNEYQSVFSNIHMFDIRDDEFQNSGISSWDYNNPAPTLAGTTPPTKNMWAYTPIAKWGQSGTIYTFLTYAPFSTNKFYATSSDLSSVRWNMPRHSATDHTLSKLWQYTSKASGNTLQQLTLDHLMARLRFCFRLGYKYSRLRQVFVKSMTVKTTDQTVLADLAYNNTTEQWDITKSNITTNTVGSTSTAATTDIPLITEATTTGYSEDGALLTHTNTTYEPLASLYVLPCGTDDISLEITVTYDVYDVSDTNNGKGELLRYNETATNTLHLPRTYSSLYAGKYTNVNITIEPEFLYILGDHDADGYIIIKDN